MKCSFCNSNDADYVTTNGYNCCHKCVEKYDFVICTQCGQIVPVSKIDYPYVESLCEECFNKMDD